ncbi:fibronectin type III domain-containing protein 4, partial [Sceloporus undulatus]|uniref:fibronectin type III domain-containing protein 4 n=1 Tax=Sceloporus undulatus TaxID=8520 RepID=UPI001C4C7876
MELRGGGAGGRPGGGGGRKTAADSRSSGSGLFGGGGGGVLVAGESGLGPRREPGSPLRPRLRLVPEPFLLLLLLLLSGLRERRPPRPAPSGRLLRPPAAAAAAAFAMAPMPEFLGPAAVLVLVSCDLCLVRANRPASPVNVTVTQLKADSATVSWDVPEGEAVIGYAISQQRQEGQVQRFIREVNTTATRSCVLWDLAEDSDYVVQVQSIGLQGESAPSRRVHFRTLRRSDRLPSNSSLQGDITMEGLDADRPLQTGEIVIIVAVLLMW